MRKENKFLIGQRWAEKQADEQFKKHGLKACKKIYKAYSTCNAYAYDKKIKQTHKGDFLTKSDRDFYHGASYGFAGFLEQKTMTDI